jgi:hypothetical protein
MPMFRWGSTRSLYEPPVRVLGESDRGGAGLPRRPALATMEAKAAICSAPRNVIWLILGVGHLVPSRPRVCSGRVSHALPSLPIYREDARPPVHPDALDHLRGSPPAGREEIEPRGGVGLDRLRGGDDDLSRRPRTW